MASRAGRHGDLDDSNFPHPVLRMGTLDPPGFNHRKSVLGPGPSRAANSRAMCLLASARDSPLPTKPASRLVPTPIAPPNNASAHHVPRIDCYE